MKGEEYGWFKRKFSKNKDKEDVVICRRQSTQKKVV